MKKSTLKKGGIVLLGAMTLFGTGTLSWANQDEDPNLIKKGVASWLELGADNRIESEGGNIEELLPFVKMDLTDATKGTHDGALKMHYHSAMKFDTLGVNLLPGVTVAFAGAESETPEAGRFMGDNYESDHQNINTSSIFKVKMSSGEYGMGIYPTTNAVSAHAEFVVSTRGLKDVRRISLDLSAKGANKVINSKRSWDAVYYIYDLDGSFVKSYSKEDVFVTSKATVDENLLKQVELQTSEATDDVVARGDLDNKIVRVVLSAGKAEGDGATIFDTEALLVISNLHVDFLRPEISFNEPTTDLYEAGAGRNTFCKADTLKTTVEFWNSVGVAQGEPMRGSDKLYFEKEQASFYELSVAYPFALQGIVASYNNEEELDDKGVATTIPVSDFGEDIEVISAKYNSPENIAKYGVAADSVVTYRIPRDHFISLDKEDQDKNAYSLRFAYGFNPMEVGKFDAKEYIKGTTSARSSSSAAVELKGSSIPTYKGKNEQTFKKYREVLTSPIEFKNLPYFNAIAQEVDGKMTITQNNYRNYDGHGLMLKNVTEADEDATGRYNDNVIQRGWAITIYKEWDDDAEDWKKEEGEYLIDTLYIGRDDLVNSFEKGSWYDYQMLLENDFFTTIEKNQEPPYVVDEKFKYSFGNIKDMTIIDCSGNVTNKQIIAIDAVFRCERKDFNVSDDESLAPSELFELDPTWAYSPYLGKNNSTITVGETVIREANKEEGIVEVKANPSYFSGADFAAKKNGAIYEGPIKLNMAQAFVWYKFEDDKDMLSDKFNLDKNDLLGTYTGRADIFYSGYKISGLNGPKMQSRTHTVRIYGIGDNMEVNDKGIATIKIFKEKIRRDQESGNSSSTDDSFEFTNNGFFFTYDDTAEEPNSKYITASWKANTSMSDMAKDWRGTNVTDTLYINVDLSTAAMRESIKEDGIPVQIVYQPQNERYSFIEALIDGLVSEDGNVEDAMKASKLSWLDHAAQFGILVDNGHNEFYTFGTTDKGMISSMTVDTKIGSYANFAEFVNDRFMDKPNGNIHGVYKDAYPKDHGTYYVGSDCLNPTPREREFIISGLNLINDVEILVNSMASDSTFKKVIVAVPDADGEGYGSVTEKDGKYILSPNKYGEMLFVVNTTFAPTAADRALATDTVIAVGGESRMKHYVKDTINLIPVQTDGHDKVYFFDLNKKNSWTAPNGDEAYSIFKSHYGAYLTDTLSTVIKGDVRVPEVWLSSNVEGTDTINAKTFNFGTIVAGEEADSVIYVQGKDLPLDLDDPKLDENLVEPVLSVIADGNFTSDIEAIDIHTAATAYKTANSLDYIDGVIVAPVTVTATPDCDEVCASEGVFTVDGLCGNLKKDAKIAFAPALKSGFEVTVNKTNGGRADISWEEVKGAEYYTVSIGHYLAEKISENIFISNMVAQNDKITATLYNGTGADINSDMTINYMLVVKGVNAEGETVYSDAKDGKELNQTVWKSNVPYNFTFEAAPMSDDIKYVVGLYEFDTTADNQIDIYEFDGIYSKLNRKYAKGQILPMNKGSFNIVDWSTLSVKLPEVGFVAEATSAKTTLNKVTAIELLSRTTYDVVVTAYNDCLKDADGKTQEFKSADAQIASSISEGGDGNIQFEGVEGPEDPSVGNENINATAIKAIGGKGQVTILNAAGQKAVVANILGQVIANTVISSDNATFPASAGAVVVKLEDGTVLKAMVK